jgi:flagellar biosynthesis/type III secretory pathway M-ring protein FliF/YscJ
VRREEEDLDEEEAEARAARRLEGQGRGSQEAGPRKLSPEEEAHGILAGPENYEQRLTVAKAAVQQDPRRVAQVVRGWVNASE